MGTVINKTLPQMIQKVKGRTFYLPLFSQETLNNFYIDSSVFLY